MQDPNRQFLCIYLPSITGHHLTYLDKVLKALNQNENTLILSPDTSPLFEEIASTANKVIQYTKVFKSNSFMQSYFECRAIQEALNGVPVKKLIAPTGTTAPWLWPLFNATMKLDYHFLMLSPALINNGSYAERLLKLVLLSLHQSGRLSTIDNASYDHPGWLGRFIRKQFKLIPDPIDNQTPASKVKAFEYFGLENGFFYLLACGAMDTHPRKNAMMLIKSVASIPNEENIRLVLAGKLSNEIQEYIYSLEDEQRSKFVVFNRFMSDQELMDITHCVNLVCALYAHHYSPSGIVLRAIKTKTPVLVPNYHWFKYMVENFAVGHVLNSLDERCIAEKVVQIKNSSVSLSFQYRNDLLEYSSEQNFQQHWRERIYSDSHPMEYSDIKKEIAYE